jgi:hypothetical protein
MTYTPSAGSRRAICAVLGHKPKTKTRAESPEPSATPECGITDEGLVLYLALHLTKKPRATKPGRPAWHDDPNARCHAELQGKMGAARDGKGAGRQSVIRADAELEELRLITRGRVSNERGKQNGPHTPHRRVLHPENGVPLEVSDETLAFIAAVICDPELGSNRKAQLVRIAAKATSLSWAGESPAYESALGLTRLGVKDFFEAVVAARYGRLHSDPPIRGHRRGWLHTLKLSIPGESTDDGKQAAATTPAAASTPAPASQPAVVTDVPSMRSAPQEPEAAEVIRDRFSETLGDLRGPTGPARAAAPAATPAASEAPEPTAADAGDAASAGPAVPRQAVIVFPDLRAAATAAGRELWPNIRALMPKVLKLAETRLPAGQQLDLQTKLDKFVAPILDLQRSAAAQADPAALTQALEALISQEGTSPLYGDNTVNRFGPYLKTVFASVAKERGVAGGSRKNGAASAPTNAEAQAANSIEAREGTARELLGQAYELNKTGQAGAARALLGDMLAGAHSLAELFGGDVAACRDALRLAFKQGSTDFVGARPNPYSAVDYLPEVVATPTATKTSA